MHFSSEHVGGKSDSGRSAERELDFREFELLREKDRLVRRWLRRWLRGGLQSRPASSWFSVFNAFFPPWIGRNAKSKHMQKENSGTAVQFADQLRDGSAGATVGIRTMPNRLLRSDLKDRQRRKKTRSVENQYFH